MKRRRSSIFVVVVVAVALLLTEDVAARIRGDNGTLSLLIAVPLTKDNQTVLDPGWFHLAAAQLAVEHFNTRNASVVAELDNLQDCPFQFQNVRAVDTGTTTHQAMEYLVEELQREGPVDAIAGPYNEIPALELSVLATGMKAPMVSHRSFDTNLLLPQRHPYYSQVSPGFHSEMQFISQYLQHLQRHNYIAILYSSTAGEIQKADILRNILQKDGFDQIRSFGYVLPTHDGLEESKSDSDSQEASRESIEKALKQIQETGYRTIVCLPSLITVDGPLVGSVATSLGMDQGTHFWVFSGGLGDLTSTEIETFLRNSSDNQALSIMKGSAYTMAVDDLQPLNFPHVVLEGQSPNFFQRVQALNPIHDFFTKDEMKKYSMEEHPIRVLQRKTLSWMQGTSYMYDAVMSIGIGACEASRQQNGTAMTGPLHVGGIRSATFSGASGVIQFGEDRTSPGGRTSDTVPYAVVNILPYGTNGPLFVQAIFWDPKNLTWHNEFVEMENFTLVNDVKFVYADGTTQQPPLRDSPEMNYIDPSFRAIGLLLMSIALVGILLSAFWVYWYRHHNVVIAAQPGLLYTLCVGSAMMALAMLMYSYDESRISDEEMLDRLCVSGIWMDVLGHMISFCALFTKLWRVYRCMRTKASQVALWRVMWPSVFLIGSAVAMLSIWTGGKWYGWERQIIDETTGESIGRCNGTSASTSFLGVLYFLHFIPAVLAGIMAFKTTGIDDTYSESKWVLAFILVQVQVLIVAVPLVMILQDVDSNGRFIGHAMVLWTFPMSIICLIFVPKILAVRRSTRKGPIATNNSENEQPEYPHQGSSATTTERESSRSVGGIRPQQLSLPSSPPAAVHDDLAVTVPGLPPDANETEGTSPTGNQQRASRGPRIQVVTFD